MYYNDNFSRKKDPDGDKYVWIMIALSLIILYLVSYVSAVDAEPLRPRTVGALWTESAVDEFEDAWKVAVIRVSSSNTCAGLFDGLDMGGIESLTRTNYFRTVSTEIACRRMKHRKVAAYTYVGSPNTRICSTFDRLSLHAGAAILIHEALHAAGLEESRNSNGQHETPEQINGRVYSACKL